VAVVGHEWRCWLAVACAQHVRRGRDGGFMQVCHGKGGPLKRIRPGDGVAYYSPAETIGGDQPLKAFTAIGFAAAGVPYQVDMGNGFLPFRRDMNWQDARSAPIQPLLDSLSFSRDKRNWGYQLRFGLIEITAGDLHLIGAAMGASLTAADAA